MLLLLLLLFCHDDVFIHLDRLWGPHSIDRFASSYNSKLPRFNSRFLQSGTEAVDAFSQDFGLVRTIGSSHQQLLLVKY